MFGFHGGEKKRLKGYCWFERGFLGSGKHAFLETGLAQTERWKKVLCTHFTCQFHTVHEKNTPDLSDNNLCIRKNFKGKYVDNYFVEKF